MHSNHKAAQMVAAKVITSLFHHEWNRMPSTQSVIANISGITSKLGKQFLTNTTEIVSLKWWKLTYDKRQMNIIKIFMQRTLTTPMGRKEVKTSKALHRARSELLEILYIRPLLPLWITPMANRPRLVDSYIVVSAWIPCKNPCRGRTFSMTRS